MTDWKTPVPVVPPRVVRGRYQASGFFRISVGYAVTLLEIQVRQFDPWVRFKTRAETPGTKRSD